MCSWMMYELLSDRCTGLAHRLENGSVITALDPNSGLFPSTWDVAEGNTCSIYSTCTKILVENWTSSLVSSWYGTSVWQGSEHYPAEEVCRAGGGRSITAVCVRVWGLHLDFQWSDRRVKSVRQRAGCGHSGLGRCRPSISGVSCGLWVALVGVQSPREAWAALRWAKRWVMEKPAFPSSWDRTTSTCLQKEVEHFRKKKKSFWAQNEHFLSIFCISLKYWMWNLCMWILMAKKRVQLSIL